jgi:hypothetical protein
MRETLAVEEPWDTACKITFHRLLRHKPQGSVVVRFENGAGGRLWSPFSLSGCELVIAKEVAKVAVDKECLKG